MRYGSRKASKKYISLMELHHDEVEQALIQKDEQYGYIDIFDCDEDDYYLYEDCAHDYFILKNIDIVEQFNNDFSLTNQPLNYLNFFQYHNEIYYRIDFKNINKESTHPLVILLLEHFKALADINLFNVHFLFKKEKWSHRDDLSFDIIIAVNKATLFHRPSRFSLSTIDTLEAPEYADNGFKRLLFNDIQRRPQVYNGFDDIEELITNFEDYSWIVDAITC
jgi:hypothetical protein